MLFALKFPFLSLVEISSQSATTNSFISALVYTSFIVVVPLPTLFGGAISSHFLTGSLSTPNSFCLSCRPKIPSFFFKTESGMFTISPSPSLYFKSCKRIIYDSPKQLGESYNT